MGESAVVKCIPSFLHLSYPHVCSLLFCTLEGQPSSIRQRQVRSRHNIDVRGNACDMEGVIVQLSNVRW